MFFNENGVDYDVLIERVRNKVESKRMDLVNINDLSELFTYKVIPRLLAEVNMGIVISRNCLRKAFYNVIEQSAVTLAADSALPSGVTNLSRLNEDDVIVALVLSHYLEFKDSMENVQDRYNKIIDNIATIDLITATIFNLVRAFNVTSVIGFVAGIIATLLVMYK